MLHRKSSEYSLYRRLLKRTLLVVGLWPQRNPRILYRLLPFFFLLANTFVTAGCVLFIKAHSDDVTTIMRGISTVPSFLTVHLKIICVLLNRNEAIELHNQLDHHYSKLFYDQQISKIPLADSRSFRRLSWIFTALGTVMMSTIALTPILSLLYQKLSAVSPINYPLVYSTQYPWSVNPPSFRYKIHILIEYAAVVPHFCVSHLDCLFIMYGYQMICQFREMSHRIIHIDETTDGMNTIKKCVDQYQTILECRDRIQKIFGPILLWVWTANAVSLCSFFFQVTQMKHITIPTMIVSVGFVVFKLIQTYMYAFTGTCIITESENYQRAIYDANWQKSQRLMTSILIMITQQPIKLTACSFLMVSSTLFIKFLNTAVSYFCVLQTVS